MIFMRHVTYVTVCCVSDCADSFSFYISSARLYYLRVSLYGIGSCELISGLIFESLYTVFVAKITIIFTSLGGVPGPWTFDVTAVREI